MIAIVPSVCRVLSPEMTASRVIRKGLFAVPPADPLYPELAAFVRAHCVARDTCLVECGGVEWTLWMHHGTGEIRGTRE